MEQKLLLLLLLLVVGLLLLLWRHDKDREGGCLRVVMGLDSRNIGHGLLLLLMHLVEHHLHVLVVLLLEDLLPLKLHLLLDRVLLLLLLLVLGSEGLLGESGVAGVGRRGGLE